MSTDTPAPKYARTLIDIEVEIVDPIALEAALISTSPEGDLVSRGAPDHNDMDHKVAGAISDAIDFNVLQALLANAGLRLLGGSTIPRVRAKPGDDYYTGMDPFPARRNDGSYAV